MLESGLAIRTGRKRVPALTAWGGPMPWVYALAITAAELLVGLVNVRSGLLLHFTILLALLIHAVIAGSPRSRRMAGHPGRDGKMSSSSDAAVTSGEFNQDYCFYLAMTLCPLIRILSLTMPLAPFPLMYWYMIVGIPLFAAAFVVVRLAGYAGRSIWLRAGRLPLQLAIGLVGLPLGLMEFYILHPTPLVPVFDLSRILLPAFILLVFTGFAEELIFRGILQKAAQDYLGRRPALIYVSFLFAVLHITHLSALDVFFVFGVAVLFAVIVRRTGSLLGVTLAHGLTNITMYLIWPFIL